MLRLTDKQKEFWKCADRRWNIKEGAVRSGKTYLDYFLIPRRIRAATGEGLIVLLGHTRGTLERNVLEPMRKIWGRELVGRIHADGSAELFGKRCYTLGADKASQAARLQGTGIEYCYGDEITTWSEEVFSMLKSRMDKPGSVFDGTCNPAGPNHWLLKFLESGADIFRQHYTVYDNPALSEDFVKNLEKEYAGSVYFDRFILGKWALAEGLIYPMFDPKKHVFSGEAPEGEYFISVDYGTLNPCSMGLWCVAEGRAWRIREFYHDGRKKRRQMTDGEYYEQLEALAGDLPVQYVTVDPSAASFIEVIRRHGRFSVRRAKNSVADGIRYTAGLISGGKIMVHSSCGGFLGEIGGYSWDTSADGDRPLKMNDHAMDDMRYFCYTILKRLW